MNWAQRRQLLYIAIVLMVFFIVAGVSLYKTVTVAPSCFDGKKNGTELGVDCGRQSSCNKYCSGELQAPVVRWVRVFPVNEGYVHAVAYIEHGNPTAASYSASYTFRLYDKFNSLIVERKGTSYIGPAGKTAMVETLIPVGTTNPSEIRTTFAFDPLSWQKVSAKFSGVVINTDRTLLETTETGTRLTATIENESRYQFRTMDVAALLYDADDNVITASKALLPELDSLATKNVVFTWSYRMPKKVVRIEIVPRFNPFTAKEF